MSISTALANATTGLRAASRAADVVSGNISNAMTPGYARRDIVLSALTLGGDGAGVRVAGISRATDPLAIADRRLAEAAFAHADTMRNGLLTIERALGTPDDPGSLSARAAAFESSLIEAASRPDANERLTLAVSAAQRLADTFNTAGREIQQLRGRADSAIARMVNTLNQSLAQVDRLNDEIVRAAGTPGEANTLIEQRQRVIDGISEIIPLRQLPRAYGAVALVSTNGMMLLDGKPRPIEFAETGTAEPWMSMAGGALSGLSIDGRPIPIASADSALGGGALQAQFDIRDRLGPEAQAGIDALARDLIERFQDPGLDPSIATAGLGLFTNAGIAFDIVADPLSEEGLAQRLSVNSAVVPGSGGAVWRLRDGIGAAAPGDAGQSGLITAMADRLVEPRTAASGPMAGIARSLTDQIAGVLSGYGISRQAQENETAFRSALVDGLREREAASGVDTDDEMQKLLLIEQNYGANARVVQTLDELMNTLLSL
jgi:flagellar hook-associated protein 1 FlgK